MARAEIHAGICGFKSQVETTAVGDMIRVVVHSECKAIQRMAEHIEEVDPLREFTFRGMGPETYDLAVKYCSHAACPVPVGIIKAVEIEAGLALPADVSIKLEK